MTLEQLRMWYYDPTKEGPNLMEDWELCSPKERIALMSGQIEEYFVPKRQRTSIDPNDQELPDDIYTN